MTSVAPGTAHPKDMCHDTVGLTLTAVAHNPFHFCKNPHKKEISSKVSVNIINIMHTYKYQAYTVHLQFTCSLMAWPVWRPATAVTPVWWYHCLQCCWPAATAAAAAACPRARGRGRDIESPGAALSRQTAVCWLSLRWDANEIQTAAAWRCYEHLLLHTGCTAQSPMRLWLANDSRETGWSIGALLTMQYWYTMRVPSSENVYCYCLNNITYTNCIILLWTPGVLQPSERNNGLGKSLESLTEGLGRGLRGKGMLG